MRVVIVTSIVPFVRGGDRMIIAGLESALLERGHMVDTFRLPVHPTPGPILPQMVGLRSIDLTGSCDRLIAVRTPSYLVRHPHKVVWFIHHRRPSYDLWETHRDVPDDGAGWEHRRLMFSADEVALGEARAVFANSRVMADRLRQYNGIDAGVLQPPLAPGHSIVPGPQGNYVLTVSRLARAKRPELAVRALAATRSSVRLVLAGKAEVPDYGNELRALAHRLGVADRVDVVDEWVSEERKRDLLGGSLAVLALPIDEDSYSYAALEGAAAAKPIVTTTDSGGVLELVRDGVNGLVCAPEPIAIGAAIDQLHENRAGAAAMGAGQGGVLRDLGLDWDRVVGTLLQ